MENYCAQQNAWRRRLHRERQAQDWHCQAYYGLERDKMFPPVPRQLSGEQARELIMERMRASAASVPVLPGAGSAASVQVNNRASKRDGHVLDRPPLGMASTGMARGSGRRRPSAPSSMSSFPSRSPSSYLTSSSLRREIEQAVQEQVAALVKPLKDQLEDETLARRRAEEALKEAGLSYSDNPSS